MFPRRLVIAMLTLCGFTTCGGAFAAQVADQSAADQLPSMDEEVETVVFRVSELLNEQPWYDVSACDHATSNPGELDEAEVCSRQSVEDLLALVAGWGKSCTGKHARKLIREIATQIDEKRASRAQIYEDLNSIPPEKRHLAYEQIAFFGSRKEWITSERYLVGLEKYLTAYGTFSELERVLAYEYFNTAFGRLNPILRKGGRKAECLKPLVDAMISTFRRLPRYQGTVWRGLSLPSATLNQYQVGAEIAWPAFTSTSTSKEIAKSFAVAKPEQNSALFEIRSKNCVDALGASEKIWEEEVLCLPDTRVRVIERSEPNRVVMEEN